MSKQLHELLKFSPKKIAIIDFYLTHHNNNAVEIAEKMGVSYWFVSNTINEWFDNDKTITIASKL